MRPPSQFQGMTAENSFCAEAGSFSLPHRVQTGSEAYPAS